MTNKIRKKTISDLEQSWTEFGFKLEEKLGELLEPEETLQIFSDYLKQQIAYDYLEITFLPDAVPKDSEPLNWIRNDTGYGDKFLSLLLKSSFKRGLPRRRQAVVVSRDNCSRILNNPELLLIMELQCGILIPLTENRRTIGVLKLFFQKQLRFSGELKKWLTICAGTLQRAIKRAWHYQSAQKMATVDGLTGLYNHRYFMEQFQKEFQRARRYKNDLTLILIDIDFFKHYNDANGHLAGDRVLKKVARSIKNSVREIDLVARWGGEEFALLLPQINAKNGMIVAEKIRREVETLRFKNEKDQPNGKLTISLGVAENSPDLKSYREMFKRADAALYQAKHEGRNRCVSAK